MSTPIDWTLTCSMCGTYLKTPPQPGEILLSVSGSQCGTRDAIAPPNSPASPARQASAQNSDAGVVPCVGSSLGINFCMMYIPLCAF
jgi:hypothetical protein